MRSTLLRSTAALATTVVLVSACGGGSSDDAGQAIDGADFCERITAFQAAADDSDGTIDAESLAQLQSLRDIAPDAIRDDMIVLVDLFEKLENLDENDEDSTEEVFTLLFDPAVIEAGEHLETFGVEECGFEPSTDDVAEFDDDGLVFDDDDALYDPFFDDPVDPNEASIDGLKLYLDETHPEATWRPRLSSFGQSGGDFQAGGVDVTDDALAICAAVLAYATGFDPAANAEVSTFSEDFADEVTVATGNATDGCVTV